MPDIDYVLGKLRIAIAQAKDGIDYHTSEIDKLKDKLKELTSEIEEKGKSLVNKATEAPVEAPEAVVEVEETPETPEVEEAPEAPVEEKPKAKKPVAKKK